MAHCADRVMEHFSDKGMEHCDDEGHGALWLQRSQILVMMQAWNIVITNVMKHCDDWSHGAL